jgi:GTP-binding protein HflX
MRNAIAPAVFLRALTELSREIERQIGVFVDRRGHIQQILVGEAHRIVIPELGRLRAGQVRFRGLRLIHTHLDDSPLTKEDLHDLVLSRFDLIAVVAALPDGLPGDSYYAYLLPENVQGELWRVEGPFTPQSLEAEDFLELITSLEAEFTKASPVVSDVQEGNRAILVGVYDHKTMDAEARMDELEQLAYSAGLYVLSRELQRRDHPDPRYMLGQGKLEQLIMYSMQLGADMLVFDADLTPTQSRNIAERTDLKIIDRSQLILDIFAQRAHSRDGKLQVELAQLKYLLPHLNRMSRAMSRLTGGIGGRGPGETKLEIDRRRARERIHRLEIELERVCSHRQNRRRRRQRENIPIVSVVGYTNAGKSTLLNTLTTSDVLIENRMFTTLDPVSRRFYLPGCGSVLLTDTVGFIRDLPADLVTAFQATLEELQDADLLLHIIDISDASFPEQIIAVERILNELELHDKLNLRVFNKIDLVDQEECNNLCRRYQALGISAHDSSTLTPLLAEIENMLLTSQLKFVAPSTDDN